MKKNKTLLKWMGVIDEKVQYVNSPFTEHEIIYLRKAIGASGLKCPMDRIELVNHFHNSMPEEGYNITADHQAKRINYLLDNTFKKNGQLRKNPIFSDFELRVISDFKEFKFVGLHREGYSEYYLPLYECISNQGDSFTYTVNEYSMRVITDIYPKKLKVVKMRQSLYKYSDDELLMIVENDEYFYNMMTKKEHSKLKIRLREAYQATNKQWSVLNTALKEIRLGA